MWFMRMSTMTCARLIISAVKHANHGQEYLLCSPPEESDAPAQHPWILTLPMLKVFSLDRARIAGYVGATVDYSITLEANLKR